MHNISKTYPQPVTNEYIVCGLSKSYKIHSQQRNTWSNIVH